MYICIWTYFISTWLVLSKEIGARKFYKLPQSKYPVLHQGSFDGTGFLFLGCLGSRANTEKKGSGPIMSSFLGWFFHDFRGKKQNQKYFRNRTEKLHKVKKFKKVEKTGFFRAKFFLHCTLSVILGLQLTIIFCLVLVLTTVQFRLGQVK